MNPIQTPMDFKAYIMRSDVNHRLFDVVLVNSDHSVSQIALKNKEYDTACEFVLKYNSQPPKAEALGL